jgi:uncharacterized membrane protein YfcA
MFWWIIATLLAFFVKGLCGFANTLVFTSILSFGNSNINISPVDLMLTYPPNLIMAWKERGNIQWSMFAPLSAMIVIGSVPGILFLKNADVSSLKILFGALVIFFGVEMLIRELQKKKIKQSKLALYTIGVLAGIVCGLFGVGALLSAYVGRVTEDSSSFKANMCSVFCVENTLRLILYIAWGIITLESVKQALILAPFMLIGLILGMKSSSVLDEKNVKKAVIVMLIISGVALIITSL